MSNIHRTTTHTTTTARHATTHRTTSHSTAPATPTRANTDPPPLDIRNLNNQLNLTEPQRNRLRPLLTADQRKQAQISHMKWSSPAVRRSTLWQARDETVYHLQPALDPTQLRKLNPLLGPTA